MVMPTASEYGKSLPCLSTIPEKEEETDVPSQTNVDKEAALWNSLHIGIRLSQDPKALWPTHLFRDLTQCHRLEV